MTAGPPINAALLYAFGWLAERALRRLRTVSRNPSRQ